MEAIKLASKVPVSNLTASKRLSEEYIYLPVDSKENQIGNLWKILLNNCLIQDQYLNSFLYHIKNFNIYLSSIFIHVQTPAMQHFTLDS